MSTEPREKGVRNFLATRGIRVPEGQPGDARDEGTAYRTGNRKNEVVMQRIGRDGVEVFPGSARNLQAAQQTRLRRIVVSSSANTALVLHVTGLERYIEGRIDRVTLAQRHIAGKPKPDSYLAGAELAGVRPTQAAAHEDALAGVAVGRAGEFGYVVGVDRVGQADQLRARGADVVVGDLADLLSEHR
jgi:beta-phosphoglucomutase-like phosphatase (HAD superfamily)